MNVFLDTEFTDLLDPHLISLGMVTERSVVAPELLMQGITSQYLTEEFYVEVPYPDKKCTSFVRETVLPLLGREPHAFCKTDEVSALILNWLLFVRRSDEDMHICIDYETDWDLFCAAINYQVPPWIHRKMIRRDINELMLYDFFKKSGLPEHHALYDARANKYAYRPRIEKGEK
ncbi:MAG: hypothetical protein ACXWJZ_04875 [Burkholderiaceae bacterium]